MRVERSSAKLYSNGEQKQPFQRTCRAQHNERLLGVRGIYVTKVMGVQNFGHLCLGALYMCTLVLNNAPPSTGICLHVILIKCRFNDISLHKYNKFRNHSFLILLINLPGGV